MRERASSVRGWRIRAQDGRWFQGVFDPRVTSSPPSGYALPRAELDLILLQAATATGADFQPRRRVFDLVRSGERVVGAKVRGPSGREEIHHARLVVGADGLRSRVARRIGVVRPGRRRRLAIVGRFAGVLPNGPAGGANGGSVDGPSGGSVDGPLGELCLSREGVLGYAPIGAGRHNVTIVVPQREARSLSGDLDGFFRSRLRAYGVAERVGRGRPLGPLEVTGPFELRPSRRTAPGVLLVGDATGYFDPFTGQGIYRALYLGRLAAAVACRMLERPGREAAYRRGYERALDRFLRPARRVQRAIDGVISRPGAMGPTARLLAGRPALASLLVDVTGDRLSPGSLVSPGRVLFALATAGAGRPGGGAITMGAS